MILILFQHSRGHDTSLKTKNWRCRLKTENIDWKLRTEESRFTSLEEVLRNQKSEF